MADRLAVADLAREIGQARRDGDLDRLDELGESFVAGDGSDGMPFSARLALDERRVAVDAPAAESDAAVTMANAWSRSRRQVRYRRDKAAGVRPPVVVSEGDSWFQYPVRLDDVIDILTATHGYQLLSLGAAGDLLHNMLVEREYETAIAAERADVFLVSGGGNDMLGGGRLRGYLIDRPGDAAPEQRIDTAAWQRFLDVLAGGYRMMFRGLSERFPHLRIFCHGYDYALPQGDRWLGAPLTAAGVPADGQAAVVRLLIDGLNERMIALAGDFPNVFHVDCRGAVGSARGSWHDELHPKDAGFARVADRFHQRIQQVWAQTHDRSFETTELATAPSPVPVAPPAVPAGAGADAPLTASRTRALRRNSPFRALAQSAEPTLAHPTLEQAVGGAGDFGLPEEALVADPYVSTAHQLRRIDVPPIPQEILARHGVDDAVPAEEAPLRATGLSERVSAAEVAGARRRRRRAEMIMSEVVLPDWVPDRPLDPAVAGEHGVSGTAAAAAEQPASSSDAQRAALRDWQERIGRDPENLRAYEEFRLLKVHFDDAEAADRLEQRRRLLPVAALAPQERILGESDLFPINVLGRGVRAARTVGRVSAFNEYDVPLGSGTGFLVGPDLLLTNRHVLNDAAVARRSHVLFEYEYDEDSRLKPAERFEIAGDLFCASESHDFAFVTLAPTGSLGHTADHYGRVRLIRPSGKALKGEPVSIVQHADGLPKQIAVRNSRVVGRARQFVYYITDTNPGSSGAPVLNDQWLPVALHHRSVPHYHRVGEYVANRGIRISAIFEELDRLAAAGDADAARVLALLEPPEPPFRPAAAVAVSAISAVAGAAQPPSERNVEPWHEVPYDNRQGYDPDFLGPSVPLPQVIDAADVAAPLLGTAAFPQYELKYQHFSVVMNRRRRLALFTAANVDCSPASRRPDPTRRYDRDSLGGLTDDDRERWFLDPRLAPEHQLPDVFYDRDRQAFDKGHLVRRAAIAWGDSYARLRRANGDSFHVTNCSPQVPHYNRARRDPRDGLWGDLEEEVERQARAERLCVLAGPVFSAQDRDFAGRDARGRGTAGDVVVPIPSVYWKLVLAKAGGRLEAFAFWLPQDLTGVAFEFAVAADWRRFRISVAELERKLAVLAFPAAIHDADRR